MTTIYIFMDREEINRRARKKTAEDDDGTLKAYRRECYQQYREEHREEINAYHRSYYPGPTGYNQKRKPQAAAATRKYYAANRERIAARRKEIRQLKKEGKWPMK